MELNPGRYKAHAIDANNTFVGAKQTHVCKVTLEIIDGDDAGRTIVWDGWLTERAVDRTCESLARLGYTDGEQSHGPPPSQPVVEVVVEEEEWQGQRRARVKWINEVGGKRASGGGKKRAAAKGGTCPTCGGRVPEQRADDPPPVADDDIPF